MGRKVFKNLILFLIIGGAFVILLSLGFWQLDRLSWKENILAQIEAKNNTDPMAQELSLGEHTEFARGYVTGTFDPSLTWTITPRTYEGQVGYHLLQAFKTTSGQWVLVNRGWVSNEDQSKILTPNGQMKIAGYFKTPDLKNRFTPNNRLDDHVLYAVDIEQINKTYDRAFYPLVLYQEYPKSPFPLPFDGLPQPRNKHQQYAIFWFGMAGVLVLLCGFSYYRSRRLARAV